MPLVWRVGSLLIAPVCLEILVSSNTPSLILVSDLKHLLYTFLLYPFFHLYSIPLLVVIVQFGHLHPRRLIYTLYLPFETINSKTIALRWTLSSCWTCNIQAEHARPRQLESCQQN